MAYERAGVVAGYCICPNNAENHLATFTIGAITMFRTIFLYLDW